MVVVSYYRAQKKVVGQQPQGVALSYLDGFNLGSPLVECYGAFIYSQVVGYCCGCLLNVKFIW